MSSERTSAQQNVAELVRYATLAPSSHNTQPWTFHVTDHTITVEPDLARWLDVADNSQRELAISIGCAVENLVIAARSVGYEPHVRHVAGGDGIPESVTVDLAWPSKGSAEASDELFQRIPHRRTSHAPFTGEPVPGDHLHSISQAAGDLPVTLHLVRDTNLIGRIAELTARADQQQFANVSWRSELSTWIGRGVFGQPPLMARIASFVVRRFNLGKSTAEKNRALLVGSPVVGVITSREDTHQAHVQTGRAYERVALVADHHGIGVHPMSETLEIPQTRDELARILGFDGVYPQHLFRIGYPESQDDHTPRRPVTDVLKASSEQAARG